MDDAARVGQADALWRNQHLGAIAASAQGEVRRLRTGKARAQAGSREQRGALCGVGVPVDAAAQDASAREQIPDTSGKAIRIWSAGDLPACRRRAPAFM